METVLGDSRIGELSFRNMVSLDAQENELGNLVSRDESLSQALASATTIDPDLSTSNTSSGDIVEIRPDDTSVPGISPPETTITPTDTGGTVNLPSSVKVRITIK
jgi:hypothetical protein